ncbi:MAG: S8 family peptidase [Bdellovibrionota bacterium]
MKKLLFLLALLQLPSLGYGKSIKKDSPRFDGYIVKIDPTKSKTTIVKNLANFGKTEAIELSIGSFIHLQSNTKSLNPTDTQKIAAIPGVIRIEPNYLLYPTDHEVPTNPPPYVKDPKFKSQWGLRNNGHNNWRGTPAGVDCSIIEAWKEAEGAQDIIIAVIDSGIDPTHPDLEQNLWINQSEKNGEAGVDDDGNGYIDDIYGWDFANNDAEPLDGLGHGIFTAGVIGATHNEIGVRGVIPNVKLMTLKFLSDEGPGSSLDAIKGIEYAVKNGAKIINNSWGNYSYTQVLYDMIQYANDHNVLFVAAAGNDGTDNDTKPQYPASYDLPNVISVGSHSPYDDKEPFSNFGIESVDIFAAGFMIMTTAPNHNYLRKSGTSLSAPIVSGALGLLWSKYPELSIEEIRERLIATSIMNDDYRKHGKGGRLDAYRLLKNTRLHSESNHGHHHHD